ncbi:MAG: hypothetical protein ABL953_00850 [Ilumatobacteraceae bacterium]
MAPLQVALLDREAPLVRVVPLAVAGPMRDHVATLGPTQGSSARAVQRAIVPVPQADQPVARKLTIVALRTVQHARRVVLTEIVRAPRVVQQVIVRARLVGPMEIVHVVVMTVTVRVQQVARWLIVVVRRVALGMIGGQVAVRVIRDRRVASVDVHRGLAKELVATRV